MQALLVTLRPLLFGGLAISLAVLAYRLRARARRERTAYIERTINRTANETRRIVTVKSMVCELSYLPIISRDHTHIGCWVPITAISQRESGLTLVLFTGGAANWSKYAPVLVLHDVSQFTWEIAIYSYDQIESREGDITCHETPVTLLGRFSAPSS